MTQGTSKFEIRSVQHNILTLLYDGDVQFRHVERNYTILAPVMLDKFFSPTKFDMADYKDSRYREFYIPLTGQMHSLNEYRAFYGHHIQLSQYQRQ
jgi:hypothetical protein